MAFQPLSAGDILMLSQQAWRVGRAFTKGKSSAPAQFAEVEREANGLSDALKITAETLHDDGSILARAEHETRIAVNAILESAARTLGDMESFVDRYQVVRQRPTSGGFVVEKTWSEVIVANYRTFKWTTEGGNLTDLRNMLQMHTNTLSLTMQALQSRSLARLERAVLPIAENINSIHERVNGDLGDKIDDLHHIIMAIANSTPSLVARDRAVELPTFDMDQEHDAVASLPSRQILLTDRSPRDSVQSTSTYTYPQRRSEGNRASSMDCASENGRSLEARRSTGRARTDKCGQYDTVSQPSPTSPRRISNSSRRESTSLPTLRQGTEDPDLQSGSPRSTHSRRVLYDTAMSPVSPRRTESWRSSSTHALLPPPALSWSPTRQDHVPATPSSVFTQGQRQQSDSRPDDRQSRLPLAKSARADSPITPALSSLQLFEKSLFCNAAILCDVRCSVIEYAQTLPDEPDPRYNIEMVEACQDARIVVIRKRENREHGGTRLATSIWALSDDGTIRCQQKLSEIADTVPYCSYFQPEKVSIGDAEMCLRFHGLNWTDMAKQDVKTNWVNYILESENDATLFQSAVFGRQLLGSFRTTKTIVLRQGLMGTFAFEEQFANIETLRLWEDDGVATPGAQGGVMALMHISSNFGEGWARWWMNSTKQQVHVKGEGFKCARLKGIDVTVVKPGISIDAADRIRRLSSAANALQRMDTKDSLAAPQVTMKRRPVKKVTGVRIEFRDDGERRRFVEASGRLQERLLPLPDL
ncbi:uncharacterized protein LTR77_008590 [Saxophila tyrrhenica]|uniref:Uncharacterized protein n=1 Tax=Saxophila tyrrhenica TaxID=1690608 RepID=A0AAV9P1C1_9PEZI|nr:hypothetical protein LTR77_008590 [Saxophila tyrrhenica]